MKPWKASNNREKLDTDNGLLLCVLHDGLFDKGLISFSPTGNILISETLTQEDRDKLHLDEAMTVKGADPANAYFQYHREHVFKK